MTIMMLSYMLAQPARVSNGGPRWLFLRTVLGIDCALAAIDSRWWAPHALYGGVPTMTNSIGTMIKTSRSPVAEYNTLIPQREIISFYKSYKQHIFIY